MGGGGDADGITATQVSAGNVEHFLSDIPIDYEYFVYLIKSEKVEWNVGCIPDYAEFCCAITDVFAKLFPEFVSHSCVENDENETLRVCRHSAIKDIYFKDG